MLINAYRYTGYGDFPVIHSSKVSQTASGTTHTLDIPGGVQTGDLLIAVATIDASPTVTGPSGWTSFGFNSAATANRGMTYYRIADGTEANTTFSTSTSQASVACVLQIGNWHGSTAPESGTATGGSNSTPTSPNRTASWGSANNLWLSVIMMDGIVAVTSYPTNYSYSQLYANSGGANDAEDVSILISARQLAASAENPGLYATDVSKYWGAQTIVVRPK